MTEGQIIKNFLQAAKKGQKDLLKQLGWKRLATLNDRLSKNDIDEELIVATATVTEISAETIRAELKTAVYEKGFNSQRDQKHALEVELESLKKQLAAKDETIAAKNELIENLKAKVAEQLEDIKLLTSQIKDKL